MILENAVFAELRKELAAMTQNNMLRSWIGTIAFAVIVAISSPQPALAQACDKSSEGLIIYNSTIKNITVCDGTQWKQPGVVPGTQCGSAIHSMGNTGNENYKTTYVSCQGYNVHTQCPPGFNSERVSGSFTSQQETGEGSWTEGKVYLSCIAE